MANRSGFQLANDLIWMHGYRGGTSEQFRPRGGVPNPYRSLPSAIFVLAFAAGEERVKAACGRVGLRLPRGGPMHLGSENFVSRWQKTTGQELAARTRTAPFARGGIHHWELLEGNDLDQYLREGYTWRNLLAHTGTPDRLGKDNARKFKSRFYRRAVHRGDGAVEFCDPTVNLNLAEGILQAAQDIAYLTSTPTEQAKWTWVAPRWTAPGAMPDALAFDDRFALPADLVAWAQDRNAHDPNGWR